VQSLDVSGGEISGHPMQMPSGVCRQVKKLAGLRECQAARKTQYESRCPQVKKKNGLEPSKADARRIWGCGGVMEWSLSVGVLCPNGAKSDGDLFALRIASNFSRIHLGRESFEFLSDLPPLDF
jgi:hypothetical protein